MVFDVQFDMVFFQHQGPELSLSKGEIETQLDTTFFLKDTDSFVNLTIH